MNIRPDVDFDPLLVDAGIPTDETALAAMLAKAVKDADSTLSNDSRMSPFWRWVRAVVVTPVLWLVNELLAKNVLPAMFTATATGAFADLKAWETNTTRKPAQFTVGNIAFTKKDAQQAVVIKAGTEVTTERIDDHVYRLHVQHDVLIPIGKLTGLIPCKASVAGKDYNLAAGYFNILPVAVAGIERVTNPTDWIVQLGADIETDDELCLRSRNAFSTVGRYHIDAAYRAIISRVAGIRPDLIWFKNTGDTVPGSADALILMEVGETPQHVLDQLNDYINHQGYHGHGDLLTCKALPCVPQVLTVVVYVSNTLEIEARTAIQTEVEFRIRAAFRENDAFPDMTRTYAQSLFSFSEMVREIHNAMPTVKQITINKTMIQSGLSIPVITTLSIEVKNEIGA